MLPLFFFYGFFAACAGLLLQIFLLILLGSEVDVLNPSSLFLIAAAFIEELTKLVFLWQASRRFGDSIFRFTSLMVFGLGFAILEILFGLFLNPHDLSPLVLIATNGFFHILTTILLGLTLRRFSPSSIALWGILAALTLLHSLYNLFRLNTP